MGRSALRLEEGQDLFEGVAAGVVLGEVEVPDGVDVVGEEVLAVALALLRGGEEPFPLDEGDGGAGGGDGLGGGAGGSGAGPVGVGAGGEGEEWEKGQGGDCGASGHGGLLEWVCHGMVSVRPLCAYPRVGQLHHGV